MKTRNVTYTLDNLPPLDKEEIKALKEMSDEKIDYSDIPQIDPKQWKNAIVGGIYKPTKKQVTWRIDSDILLWLKSSGRGWQTRANQILREKMLTA